MSRFSTTTYCPECGEYIGETGEDFWPENCPCGWDMNKELDIEDEN